MRCGRRLPDLRPRAPARVDIELRERRLVQRGALGLARDRPIPVEPERHEIGELAVIELLAHAPAIKVFHPHEKAPAALAREQPGQQRSTQIPEMEIPGGGWCE